MLGLVTGLDNLIKLIRCQCQASEANGLVFTGLGFHSGLNTIEALLLWPGLQFEVVMSVAAYPPRGVIKRHISSTERAVEDRTVLAFAE